MKAIDGQAPHALTTALFLTFVFIADVEGSLTSREVERLNKLLADMNWVDDALMHAALAGLGTHYTALWKAYDAGSITRDRQRLAAELARALNGLDANSAASVRAALRSFAQRIADSGSPVLARLGLGAAARVAFLSLSCSSRIRKRDLKHLRNSLCRSFLAAKAAFTAEMYAAMLFSNSSLNSLYSGESIHEKTT